MAVLTFVAFLVGIFSVCYSAPSQAPEADLTFTFDLNGVSHTETRKVEGSIVTLTNVIDGFLVVLDYERNIFMLKNLTSQTCSFSRLDDISVTEDEKVAIFVQEVTETSLLENRGQEANVVFLEKVGTIPVGYVRLTNDATVAEMCTFQPSYWLRTKNISRLRRDRHCGWGDWDTIECFLKNTERSVTTIFRIDMLFRNWFG